MRGGVVINENSKGKNKTNDFFAAAAAKGAHKQPYKAIISYFCVIGDTTNDLTHDRMTSSSPWIKFTIEHKRNLNIFLPS